jgi:hypothetical protein
MKGTWLLGGFAICAIVAACSDDEAAEPQIGSPEAVQSSDADGLLRDSLAAMEELNSYRQEFTFRPEGQPIVFLVDYADPGDYYERILEAPAAVRGPDFTGTVELILAGDKSYTRVCDEYPDNCDEWDGRERENQAAPSAGGLTTTVPETLGLVAIELVEGPRLIQPEEEDGASLNRIRGSLNLAQSIYENQKRVLEQSGPLEDCDVGVSSSEYRDGITITATPAPETCRPITVEEALAEQWESTDFEGVPLSTVDIWISSSDSRLHRIVIGTPGKAVADESAISDEDTFFESSFSHYNEVTVTAPE